MSEVPLPSIAESEKFTPWGNVTNPLSHDPTRYRYLLHLDAGRRKNGTVDDTWEFALDDPSKLRLMPYISASLVDQDHTLLYQGTSSSHGFILEVPASSVIATHPMDMFSRSNTFDKDGSKPHIMDPDELMRCTKPTDWNEVVVSPGGLIIKAFFWVEGQPGSEPSYDRDTVMMAADAAGLPFLEPDLEKY